MTATFILSAAAEADIRSIVRYTRQQWGEGQVRSYMARLEAGITRLAAGQGAWRDMADMHVGLRVTRCEHLLDAAEEIGAAIELALTGRR